MFFGFKEIELRGRSKIEECRTNKCVTTLVNIKNVGPLPLLLMTMMARMTKLGSFTKKMQLKDEKSVKREVVTVKVHEVLMLLRRIINVNELGILDLNLKIINEL